MELRYLYRLYNELDELANDKTKPAGYTLCVRFVLDEIVKKIVELEMKGINNGK